MGAIHVRNGGGLAGVAGAVERGGRMRRSLRCGDRLAEGCEAWGGPGRP